MTDRFATLVADATAFFTELDANNRREWFEAHKQRYTTTIRQPAETLCEMVGEEIARLTGARHAGKVFRIHRDVRFSKDKRPYNPHLHMAWSPAPEERDGAPAWFFACAPGMLTVNMGVPRFADGALVAWRELVDQQGDDLAKAIAETGAAFSEWGEASLKRVPAPYDRAHPHADLLRRRSLILDAPLSDGWNAGGRSLPDAIAARCAGLLPVWRLLHEHAG